MPAPLPALPPLPSAGIHELFSQQVERSPDAAALLGNGRSLSYAELNDRANQVADQLQKCGLTPEERVGVCIERSPELVIALLGILKAGGAYLPLDPSYPPERILFMLRDAGVQKVVTARALARSVPDVCDVIIVDDLPPIRGNAELRPQASGGGGSRLAYVCYTSGSTGVPKGVEVTHQGVVRLVHNVGYVRLDRSRTLLHAAPAAFDATTFELWGALLNGARVVLLPPGVPTADLIRDTVGRFGVTTAFLTTALVNAIVDEDPRALGGLSQLLFGGEAVSTSHVARLQAACPDLQLVHVYGPTETTTFATAYSVEERIRPGQTTIPIGKAIEHTTLHVLGDHGRPVQNGEVGELYIGGPGVARGYLGRPELTAERFVADPTSSGSTCLYRSGDLVRALPSGDLAFVGRVDHQVKIRGHRIELGEIEVKLSSLPIVAGALVLCREDRPGEKRLVAYVVATPGQQARPADLRQLLAAELPEYMVPKFYVRLDRFPLTANGKVDRAALPPPSARDAARDEEYRAPQGQVESELVAMWERLLGVEPVGAADDFFELGGHSLLATRMLSHIRERFEVDVALSSIFAKRTVRDVAPLIEAVLYLNSAAEEQTQGLMEIRLEEPSVPGTGRVG